MIRFNAALLCCGLTVLTVSQAACEPKYYIRVDNRAGDRSANRRLLESYGAIIVHEFPPSEFICRMEPRQFQKFLSENGVFGEHESVATARAPMNYENERYSFQRLVEI
jgi:hypothetical protein